MPTSAPAPGPQSASVGTARIRRARGFRLYGVQGERYLDLYRDGALLGHRGMASLTAMKSALSQGLATALPSVWEARLVAALLRVLPGFRFIRLFSSRDRALEAVSKYLCRPLDRQEVHDPALDSPPAGPALPALWRPLLPVPPGAAALLPVLPFTLCGAPAPACFPEDLPADFPGSDPLPGFLLAGAVRGLGALVEGPTARPHAAPRLGSPGVERAVDGAHGWKRAGPYVRAVFPAADYPHVHAEFLRMGVLLCPGYPGPSVLPGECSPGENKLLADLFARIPGG
jgi:hypothetical protein